MIKLNNLFKERGVLRLNKNKINFARVVVFSIAITFLAIGLIREEHLVVLTKAANICLECIGIG